MVSYSEHLRTSMTIEDHHIHICEVDDEFVKIQWQILKGSCLFGRKRPVLCQSSGISVQDMKTSPKLPSFWISTITLLLITNLDYVRGLGKKGDPCTSDTDCDQDSFILCDKNLRSCACPQVQPYFYTLEGKCVSYAGGICTYTQTVDLPAIGCVDNAICLRLKDPTDVNGKCACKNGYIRTKANQCAKEIPLSNNSKRTGGGGIQTSQRKTYTTRYPEPYHSFSVGSNFNGSFKLFFLIPPIFFTFKIFEVI